MKRALLLILLVPLAALAQGPPGKPPARIESIRTSLQGGEVRVDIEVSSPIPSPGSVAPYADELIVDLPGVTYDRMGERIKVNKSDVRDIRVWMQQQKPPVARISVGMTRDKAYTLTAEGNHLILRIGPGMRAAAQRNRKGTVQQEAIVVVPAGRSSRSMMGTVGAIFTREAKRPVTVSRRESVGRTPGPTPPRQPVLPIQIDEIAAGPSIPKQTAGREAMEQPLADLDSSGERKGSPPQPPAPNVSANAAPPAIASPAAPGGLSGPVAAESAPSNTAGSQGAAPITGATEAPATTAQTPPTVAGSIAPVGSARPTQVSAAATPEAEATAPTISGEVPASAGAGASEPPAEPKVHASAPAPGEAVLSAAVSPEMISPDAAAAPLAEPEPAAAPEAMAAAPPVPNAGIRMLFHIKFVQQDTAYIDGGRTAGLTQGMKLLVSNSGADGGLPKGISSDAAVAELVVIGIAETSAVTEIRTPKRDVVPGDLAYLTDTDVQGLVQQRSLSATRKYPVVISFTEEDDALDQEARVLDVPRAPLPSVNRMQGRFGFDYIGTQNLGASQSSGKDVGIVMRADFTRIGGTYWNLQGYWRGRIDYLSANTQPTLQELINRTYHLALTYDNPTGHWVAGFGRLLIPWASSLDTIDGGYFGRRLRRGIIAGVFAGSTPDPTSWNYSPNRQIGGTFVNFSGGSFEALHYSSTAGTGENLLSWKIDRPMAFFENSISYRRNFSIYHALQADSPAGNAATAAPGPGVGRSFLTVRWSPFSRLDLDFNHTYFRNVPTFDPRLIGTGLLDKYLFQGFSGGARVGIVKQISIYTELGRSNRSGDSNSALNSMYGISWARVPWLDARADVRYSRFNSSFGSGSYRAISLTRNFRENLRLDVLAGTQAFTSTLSGNQTAKFLNTTVDSNLGSAFFVQGGFTVYRGQQQNYNQWMLMMGYRFDSRWRRR
jgi:hypothetical protein